MLSRLSKVFQRSATSSFFSRTFSHSGRNNNLANLQVRANIFFKKGNYQKAVELYNRVLASDPHNARALCNKGLTLHQQGKLAPALRLFNNAIQQDPNCASAFLNKGNVFFEQGQFEQAIKCYDQAILKKKSANAYFNKGRSLVQLNKLDEAIVCFDLMIPMTWNDARPYINKAFIYAKLLDDKKVLESIKLATQLEPNNIKIQSCCDFLLEQFNCYQIRKAP